MEKQPGEVGSSQDKACDPKLSKKCSPEIEAAISAIIISLFFIFSVVSVLLIK